MNMSVVLHNLQYMRRFFIAYPKQQTLSVKLSWSHYIYYIPNKEELIKQVQDVINDMEESK